MHDGAYYSVTELPAGKGCGSRMAFIDLHTHQATFFLGQGDTLCNATRGLCSLGKDDTDQISEAGVSTDSRNM